MIRFWNWLKKIFGMSHTSDNIITKDNPSNVPMPETQTGSEIIFKEGEFRCLPNEVELCQKAVKELNRIFNLNAFREPMERAGFTSTLDNGEDVLKKFAAQINVVNITFFYGSYMQNKVWKTVGLDDGTGIVYVNRYFVDDVKTLTSLCAHEICHALGYHHSSSSDVHSVPYTMNAMVEKFL